MNNPTLKDATWIITDGRAGMLNQCLGLAEAVGLPIESRIVKPVWPWTLLPVTLWPFPFLSLGSDSTRFEPPWPRLAIGCGWRSIPFLIEIKRRSDNRTMTVQLQDPRVPTDVFDLVVPPEHDGLTGDNVVPIIGSPNRINAANLETAARRWQALVQAYPSPRIAVLVGGRSKAHRFTKADAAALGDQLRAACDNDVHCVNLAGYTRSVRHLMTLFHRASMLITNDGGPGQFAAMTPIQTIVFFGPETPALYRSWSPHAHAFFTALPCAPCLTAYNHRSSPCDGDNQCLKRILPGEVLAKARDMLKRATPAAVDAA